MTRSDELIQKYKEEMDDYIEEIEKLLRTRLEPETDYGVRLLLQLQYWSIGIGPVKRHRV